MILEKSTCNVYLGCPNPQPLTRVLVFVLLMLLRSSGTRDEVRGFLLEFAEAKDTDASKRRWGTEFRLVFNHLVFRVWGCLGFRGGLLQLLANLSKLWVPSRLPKPFNLIRGPILVEQGFGVYSIVNSEHEGIFLEVILASTVCLVT